MPKDTKNEAPSALALRIYRGWAQMPGSHVSDARVLAHAEGLVPGLLARFDAEIRPLVEALRDCADKIDLCRGIVTSPVGRVLDSLYAAERDARAALALVEGGQS